ncbi:Homoserine/homoserine lactone efflux protein [Marinomonas aquimarina]|uniref:Homoserine/homoserine lactone efflux protein n=1 Tax=Marinomonas aquimarina TaxID=295068 RepID=A0A1A8TCX4_9GAMM|nr:LysE family translocator [Marinomonas aquimarina]SBS30944.1 Homoserine/homoserine lactone efflux protein [Marinomonas aquimarina]
MESQLAFLAVCLASAASPGPGGLAVVSNSINHNLRRTLPVIFGIATGLLLASLLANTWLLAVIHSSDRAFLVMTWLCSAYIAYLGAKALYYANREMTIAAQGYGFKNGVLISLLNPKTLVFFGALFPMFITNEANFIRDAIVLTLELVLITLVIHILVSSAIDKISHILKNHLVAINRITGVMFIALGISGFIF